uniref:28 kDa Metastriate family member n=1 Tax=Rhipicephalus zambeziensis TaxID=60191 RepID=A0A224YB56_9ACAR
MMKVLTEIVVCFCILKLSVIIFSSNVAGESHDENQLSTGPTKLWWELAPHDNRTLQPIGKNVTLYAYVIYNSGHQEMEVRQNEKKEIAGGQETADPMRAHFVDLFREVEQYFHNHSIMIKVTVKNVIKQNLTSAFGDNWFDANGTLENLTRYGETLGEPRNTVFYYFTWSTRIFNGAFHTAPNIVGQSDVETYETFCTNKTSGAVIRYPFKNTTHWSTTKATLLVFGSSSFLVFKTKDWEKMNETFSKCPNDGIPALPAC